MGTRGKGRERYWQAHVAAWGRSGLTQREYCRRQGISEWSFSDWKRSLANRSQSAVSFVPVARMTSSNMAGGCGGAESCRSLLTLVVGSGYRVEVSEGFSGETLARLLAVLGRQ